MSLTIPAVITTLCGTLVLTLVYWYLYYQYRERYIRIWAAGWTVYSARFIFDILLYLQPQTTPLLAGQHLAVLVSGFMLLWGTYLFLNKPFAKWWIYCIVLNAGWVIFGILAHLPSFSLDLPTFLFVGLIYIWTGAVFLKAKEIEGFGRYLAGWAFIVWGIHKANYPFLKDIEGIALWGYMAAALLESAVALGTLLSYFQKIHRDLSNSERRFRLMAENARDITESKQAEDALRESYRRFREMLETVHLATVTINEQGQIIFCNQYLLRLTGWSNEQLLGQDMFDILIPEAKRDYHRQRFWERVKNNAPVYERFEREVLDRDGQTHSIWWNTSLLRDADGRAIGISCIGEDISEVKKSEEVLKRYQLLSEHAWDIMLFLSREGRVLEANDAALRAYGYSREEILSKTLYDLRAPEETGTIDAKLSQAENQSILYETVHRRKDGTDFPVEASLQGANIGEAKVMLAIMRDITDRKRAEETINHLAYHDPLTDLPNRILFYDRLTVAMATARRNGHMLAVMFLDLDRFKFVNDLMGHAVGDQLLNDVAHQLLKCVRRNDTVARIGGDEFTILLPQVNHEEDAAKVARNLIKVLKKPWTVNNFEVLITASIGIALFPNDGEDAETLTANADTAMYRAKEEGDNYQFYTSAMNVKNLERLTMEKDLKKAVEADEFVVYYQPQVNIKAGRMVGVEALLRWQHPEKGLLLPDDFISLAEDTGLINSIGELVLRTACRQAKAWQLDGMAPMRVAVNLSAGQFRQKNLVETIAFVLEETGLSPSLLELEITESTAMKDLDFSIKVLKHLREMGINIAIDDFGTGYSSLNYLRRFPITTLKIDRSFVRDVLTDVGDAAIVATIIVLAQNMKLKVIVEGVETQEQMAFFSQQECFEMQGHLFSESVPADQISVFMPKAAQSKK